ncbi:MAG: hypothetical protein HY344_01165 [Candidatus Levybacteria bacterium]|nr:hypothetical protein [Candidatus Levybacteria bacterium]
MIEPRAEGSNVVPLDSHPRFRRQEIPHHQPEPEAPQRRGIKAILGSLGRRVLANLDPNTSKKPENSPF